MSLNQIDRTVVEARVLEQLEAVRKVHKFESIDQAYDYVVDHWYQCDPFWLKVVCAIKESGRLQ